MGHWMQLISWIIVRALAALRRSTPSLSQGHVLSLSTVDYQTISRISNWYNGLVTLRPDFFYFLFLDSLHAAHWFGMVGRKWGKKGNTLSTEGNVGTHTKNGKVDAKSLWSKIGLWHMLKVIIIKIDNICVCVFGVPSPEYACCIEFLFPHASAIWTLVKVRSSILLHVHPPCSPR